MRKLILISIYLLSISQLAQAALFDDKEARQKIVDLQQKTDVQNQATQASLDALKKSQQALEQRILSIENMIKSQGLMDLLSQIDRLNEELNKVKGDLEVAQHNIEVSQQRQKDLYADTDGRLRKLESGNSPNAMPENKEPSAQVNNTNPTPAEANAESKAFDSALASAGVGFVLLTCAEGSLFSGIALGLLPLSNLRKRPSVSAYKSFWRCCDTSILCCATSKSPFTLFNSSLSLSI